MVKDQKGRVKKKRRHIVCESDEPRERNSCPSCGSLNIKKRRSIKNYKCLSCGWIGQSIKKIMY